MHRLPRALILPHARPLLRRRPTIFPQRRYRSYILPRPKEGAVRAVRFVKPALTSSRLLTIALFAGATCASASLLWKWLDLEIEVVDERLPSDDKVSDEQQAGEEEAEGDSIYADEHSIFIPLTWATKREREFYRGVDPEWQEFLKIAKDKARQKKVCQQLALSVYTATTQIPQLARVLGQDIKLGKYWLDLTYPDGPPQEYERSGIEIGDGFAAWSQQKIDQDQQWRLVRALWPRAALESFWATGKVLTGIQYRRAKQALGWEGANPLSIEERYRHAVQMMQKQQQAAHSKHMGKAQISPESTPTTATATVNARDAATSQSAKEAATEGDAKKVPWGVGALPPVTTALAETDIPIAAHVFSSTLSRHWSSKQREPPRGTIVVHGFIEIRGSRGRMLFDVQSWYDPKTAKFVAVHAFKRNFKRWSQSPRGGP